jgi:hypothetical protein
MKNQPTPKVSRADVERVAARDFHETDLAAILAILDEYGLEQWHCEKDRVHLAALKLSGADPGALRMWIDRACGKDSTHYYDYRDLLMNAEYPEDAKLLDEKYVKGGRGKVYEADWRQYQKWLNQS